MSRWTLGFVIFGLIYFTLNSLRAYAKPISPQQQRCIQELSAYKNEKGKKAMGDTKIGSTCQKNNSDQFLACVASTERLLQSLDTSIKYCGKHSSTQHIQCVQNLGSFKKSNGKQELPGRKISEVCGKYSKQSFLECIDQTERPLDSVDSALNFCKKTPSAQQIKCARELSETRDSKGKVLLKSAKVGETCMKNSSVAFLDCVARTKSVGSCKKDGQPDRLPAAKKKKK